MWNSDKNAFMKKGRYDSYQMHANDLQSITSHYEKKGIKIWVNGQTQNGLSIIEQKRVNIQKKIDVLANDNTNFAAYFKDFWGVSHRTFGMAISNSFIGMPQIAKDRLGSSKYGADRDHFIENDEDFNLFLIEISKEAKIYNKIIELIPEYKLDLEKTKLDCCLTLDESLKEIQTIQSTLKEKEAVGYIYTNGHSHERDHFEVLIIQKDSAIKPVHWGYIFNKSLTDQQIPDLAYTEFSKTMVSKSSTRNNLVSLCPQSGTLECGTLGILYLKELLKNQSDQLRNLTLVIPYYEESNNTELKHFLLPSPQCLRYSQSSFYNQVVESLLKDSEDVELIHMEKGNEELYRVKTIKSVLSDSIKLAQKLGDHKTQTANQTMLENLSKFTARWMQSHAKSQFKREFMNNEYNRYLAYKSKRYEGNKQTLSEEKEKHGVFLQQTTIEQFILGKDAKKIKWPTIFERMIREEFTSKHLKEQGKAYDSLILITDGHIPGENELHVFSMGFIKMFQPKMLNFNLFINMIRLNDLLIQTSEKFNAFVDVFMMSDTLKYFQKFSQSPIVLNAEPYLSAVSFFRGATEFKHILGVEDSTLKELIKSIDSDEDLAYVAQNLSCVYNNLFTQHALQLSVTDHPMNTSLKQLHSNAQTLLRTKDPLTLHSSVAAEDKKTFSAQEQETLKQPPPDIKPHTVAPPLTPSRSTQVKMDSANQTPSLSPPQPADKLNSKNKKI